MDSRASILRLVLALSAQVFLSAGAVQAQVPSPPKLIVLNDNIGLGPLFEDTMTTNAFVVSNCTAAESVEITTVRPSCGCTFARAESNLVLPGQKTRILFGFHSSRQPGPFRKTVYVVTSSDQLTLSFNGLVVPMFQMQSSVVDFGVMPDKERQTYVKETTITPYETCDNVRVVDVVYDNTFLAVKAEYDPTAKVIRVKVTADTKKCPTNFVNANVALTLRCGQVDRVVNLILTGAFRD